MLTHPCRLLRSRSLGTEACCLIRYLIYRCAVVDGPSTILDVLTGFVTSIDLDRYAEGS